MMQIHDVHALFSAQIEATPHEGDVLLLESHTDANGARIRSTIPLERVAELLGDLALEDATLDNIRNQLTFTVWTDIDGNVVEEEDPTAESSFEEVHGLFTYIEKWAGERFITLPESPTEEQLMRYR